MTTHVYSSAAQESVAMPEQLNRQCRVSNPNKVCGGFTYIKVGKR